MTINKFNLHETVRHVATGGNYIIKGLPNEYFIEKTMEEAYAYSNLGGNIKFIRSKKEMEDGRFISVNLLQEHLNKNKEKEDA